MADQFIATINKAGEIIGPDGKVLGKAVENASATADAIAQTTNAAAVIDSLAKHLGDAAGNLGAKFSEIVSTYGPNAAALIHEVGRVKAMSDIGGFLLALALFVGFFTVLLKSWRTMEQMEAEGVASKNKDLASSIMVRTAVGAIGAAIGLVGILSTFSLAALYGIFSPEAYLVIKMLKW